MTDPSIRAVGAFAKGNTTSIAPTVPSGATVGDLLLLVTGVSTSTTLTVTDGWTPVISQVIGGSSFLQMSVFSKICLSGDPGSTVSVGDGATNRKIGVVLAVRDAGQIDQQPAIASSTSQTNSRTAASQTAGGRVLPILISFDRASGTVDQKASTTWTWPGTFSQQAADVTGTAVNSGDVSLAVATDTVVAGATIGGGSIVAQYSNTRGGSIVLGVRGPAAAVPWSAAAAAASPGTTASVSISGLPTAGDIAYCIISINSASATVSTPSGWTLVDGPEDSTGGFCRSYLFKRTMDGTETTVSATISASFRWDIGVIGSAGVADVVALAQDTTTTTAMTLPGYTPGASNCLALALCGYGGASGGTALAVTPPPVWVESVDSATNIGTGTNIGAWLGYNRLVGQNGVLQSSVAGVVTGSPNGSHRGNGWVVTIAPSATTWQIDAPQSLSLTQSATATRVANLDASQTLTLTQAASVARTAILSAAQSLTLTQTAALSRTALLDAAQNLVLTQVAEINRLVLLDAVQTLLSTSSVDESLGLAADAFQTLTLSQAADVIRATFGEATQTLFLNQVVALTREALADAPQVLTISQTASVSVSSEGEIDAHQVIEATQEAVLLVTVAVGADQQLAITGFAVINLAMGTEAVQALTLSQLADLSVFGEFTPAIGYTKVSLTPNPADAGLVDIWADGTLRGNPAAATLEPTYAGATLMPNEAGATL